MIVILMACLLNAAAATAAAGSPLSMHPNVTRGRGRAAAASGLAGDDPAMAAAAAKEAAGADMMGCIPSLRSRAQ